MKGEAQNPYWGNIWKQFKKRPSGMFALVVLALFCLAGIYAPLLASSKPLAVVYNGKFYFPLFRYLFYSNFYTKRIDLFFNLMIFTIPLLASSLCLRKQIRFYAFIFTVLLQIGAFVYIILFPLPNPAFNELLKENKISALKKNAFRSETWNFDLRHKNDYAKLNLILAYRFARVRDGFLKPYLKKYTELTGSAAFPTLWSIQQKHQQTLLKTLERQNTPLAKQRIDYIQAQAAWLQEQNQKITYIMMPLARPFHWEDDAGGNQALNQLLPWWELTRSNRKDMTAALIFGIRVSMLVGIVSITLALAIGIPIGAAAGYYGGKLDILIFRLIEIWESMPILFMLLLIIAILQSKSIFLVISVIGLFGWTSFCRFTRGEFFKQRNLPYIESCRALGYPDLKIMFAHILPNAVPPLLTLLPFAIMGAITSEAALSFLGLSEEGSCSWGVLMDEGRKAFPGESYLLWPPATLLTMLLISIALVGDSLRDALDPKLNIQSA